MSLQDHCGCHSCGRAWKGYLARNLAYEHGQLSGHAVWYQLDRGFVSEPLPSPGGNVPLAGQPGWEEGQIRFREELRQAVNEACDCGGGEPGDCCPACAVWHALNRRVEKLDRQSAAIAQGALSAKEVRT